jgi:OHCU decarboxylase
LTLADIKGVFEHSPWVAERAWARGPFRSVEALHRTMLQVVREATPQEQLALVRAHPELAGAEAKEGSLSADSSSEQGRPSREDDSTSGQADDRGIKVELLLLEGAAWTLLKTVRP